MDAKRCPSQGQPTSATCDDERSATSPISRIPITAYQSIAQAEEWAESDHHVLNEVSAFAMCAADYYFQLFSLTQAVSRPESSSSLASLPPPCDGPPALTALQAFLFWSPHLTTSKIRINYYITLSRRLSQTRVRTAFSNHAYPLFFSFTGSVVRTAIYGRLGVPTATTICFTRMSRLGEPFPQPYQSLRMVEHKSIFCMVPKIHTNLPGSCRRHCGRCTTAFRTTRSATNTTGL